MRVESDHFLRKGFIQFMKATYSMTNRGHGAHHKDGMCEIRTEQVYDL